MEKYQLYVRGVASDPVEYQVALQMRDSLLRAKGLFTSEVTILPAPRADIDESLN